MRNSKLFTVQIFLIILFFTLNLFCGEAKIIPVSHFEINRYLGKWYEIARIPASFEKDLTHVTATYTLQKNGKVKVENIGFKNGKYYKAVGKAKFAKTNDIGYLKVSFFGPFYADY